MSQPAREGPRVFLIYRREDTAGHARRLYDALIERFGAGRVFTDVDVIAPGVSFLQSLDRSLSRADVVIALIGRNWLTAADRSLDKPDDWVRLGVETALGKDMRVIPALVQGAAMPSRDELPESLASLGRRNAVELNDSSWHDDVQRLLWDLEGPLSPPMPQPMSPHESESRRRLPFRWWSDKRGQRKADEEEVSDVEREVE
jgi:hypothetical protein